MSSSKEIQSQASHVVACDASTKGKGLASITGPSTPPNKKGSAAVVARSADSCMALAELTFGTACTIRIMVCRKWESTDLKGRAISTDYIISDEHGEAIHCTVWSGIAHRFTTTLEEGNCYIIKGFTVKPNKDRFRLRNADKYCIQLEGNTVVKALESHSSLFQRHSFQLTPFEDIATNGSKFLLDVIGIVTRIGQISATRNNSQLLDIQLQNERGRLLRITLWGPLCDEFLERNATSQSTYILILPGLHVKEWKGEIYLSSTSATSLRDGDDISEIQTFKTLLIGAGLPPVAPPLGPQIPIEGTLQQLLHLGREQKEDRQKESVALHCKVKIETVRTKHSWYYFSCGMANCKKGVSKVGDQFWCESCSMICEFPQIRYRLHLDITDDTSSMCITVFDEIAETLIKKRASQLLEEVADDADESILPKDIQSLTNTQHVLELKSHTYFNHGDYESFTASKIVNTSAARKDDAVAPAGAIESHREAAAQPGEENGPAQEPPQFNEMFGGVHLRGATVAGPQKRKLNCASDGREELTAHGTPQSKEIIEGDITTGCGSPSAQKRRSFLTKGED